MAGLISYWVVTTYGLYSHKTSATNITFDIPLMCRKTTNAGLISYLVGILRRTEGCSVVGVPNGTRGCSSVPVPSGTDC
jgi:hypothetical protein